MTHLWSLHKCVCSFQGWASTMGHLPAANWTGFKMVQPVTIPYLRNWIQAVDDLPFIHFTQIGIIVDASLNKWGCQDDSILYFIICFWNVLKDQSLEFSPFHICKSRCFYLKRQAGPRSPKEQDPQVHDRLTLGERTFHWKFELGTQHLNFMDSKSSFDLYYCSYT